MEFKVDYWQIKLIYTFTQFETLGDMINNDAAVSSYLRNVTDKVKDYNISMGREWTGVVDPEIKRTYTNEVNGAFSHYSSMMIVTVATYIEAMVSEFFVALFLSRPAAMHNYLNPGEADSKAGRVSLKDILRQNSLDSLKVDLAKKSAKNASNGNFSVVINRVKQLVKINCDQSIVKDIELLMNTRQRVVHEAADIEVSLTEIKQHFDNAEKLLIYLGSCCQKEEVRFSDQGFLVTEYPDFTEEPD